MSDSRQTEEPGGKLEKVEVFGWTGRTEVKVEHLISTSNT